ncbi:type II toxin-antitoxin system RelE/ParE family toxin [Rhizobium rhizogenes]|uniref:type II toxin-antitoxin system RelE/ParE family toxin n=1 Tax=Rhizobium rhizogenes TaxID=359 RepID=UPI0004D67E30|nr:type II toxin-antitoxin system RelE/ParE family toxin [Rhizobium rhizogenes]KEA03433.1 plasmid stabilization protein ParE [Rhizobium rhizogenes]MQB32806.1 type II toxin-antitoxin system RelE/ParE family toxin [Rhizobium rhizogenes]NTF70530.1 type II toxin-antitoxin system RelE/ParE family toxin [Rhizobium rhizogenes]NTH47065.1 type II toxin-antitoxin system RelE/ParE family toxin [Rhizobium rhizogenes]NTH60412.1 type II toxin-antitoxin system RelE/ParE family toxin [Rhizobium rhizogenes]
MRFSLFVEAEEDIIAIAEQGVRLFGSVQARRYHDELFSLLDLIAANPRMAREREEISPPVRIHPFKAHLVVYRIEEDGAIFVIRIRHGHEDWASDSV